MSKEGFFGPAAFFHHQRPPTGWTQLRGPAAAARLRPRRAERRAGLAVGCAAGAHQRRRWSCASGSWPRRCRRWRATPTATRCCSSTQGSGDLFCDFGHLAFEAGDYLYLPRGTMWRLAPDERRRVAADPGDRRALHAARARRARPARASSTRPCWTRPRLDDAFRAHQDEAGEHRVEVKKRGPGLGRDLSLQPARCGRLARRPRAGEAQRARHPAGASHRYHIPPSVHSTFVSDRFVVCTFVAAAVRDRSRRAEGAVLPQQRRLRRGDLLPRRRLLQPRRHQRRAC